MFVTDKKVLFFSRDVTQSLAPDSEYISWCQHFLLPCSKYCWSGQVSFHWKDHFLSWLRGREKLVRVQTCYLRLCQFRLQPLQFSAENFPTSQGSKAEKCEFAVGAQAPGEFLTSLPPLLWLPLARKSSAKRGTPGKSCKSESRNLYKHFAELKYWISRCHALWVSPAKVLS